MKIKKGDTVIVVTGKDAGKKAKSFKLCHLKTKLSWRTSTW